MTRDLKANDEESWLETIWHALHGYREDSIPEGDDTAYDEAWSDICTAMAWIRDGLGLHDDVDNKRPPPSEHEDSSLLETALCVWEHILDRDGSDAAINRLRQEIGTVEMRHLAIRLAPFCCEVYALIPDSLTYDKTYDWDLVPAILDTIDFAARPVAPPVVPVALELVRKALASAPAA